MTPNALRAFAPAAVFAALLVLPTDPAAESAGTIEDNDCPPESGTGVCSPCPMGGLYYQIWFRGQRVGDIGDWTFCFFA